jgi:hypothetical protein
MSLFVKSEREMISIIKLIKWIKIWMKDRFLNKFRI